MYDLFFLSYDEEFAERNWQEIKQKWPWARRVHGVKGIREAHLECARKSMTRNFFVVDADNMPDDDFPFDIELPDYDSHFVHLWFARNLPCGMSYGWGGVKLFPKKEVLQMSSSYVDFTTTFQLKIIPEAKSTNRFNSSEFSAWRSAYRESCKLTWASDLESKERLEKWLAPNIGHSYGEFIKSGAENGHADALVSKSIPINDWEWLLSKFNEVKNNEKHDSRHIEWGELFDQGGS